MKKYSVYLSILFVVKAEAMCPACEAKQPKILFGLSHGMGPTGNVDWVIIGIISLITLLVFIYSLIYLIKPREKSPDHIKNKILIP